MSARFRRLWTEQPRLRRSSYWLLTLLISFLAFALLMVLMFTFADPNTLEGLDRFENDPGRLSWLDLPPVFLAPFALSIVVGFLVMILGVRRQRDRDRSGIDVVLCALLAALVSILLPEETIPRTIADFALGIWSLYFFVVLGFFRGTRGPNRYGPDPRAPADQPPAAATGIKDAAVLDGR